MEITTSSLYREIEGVLANTNIVNTFRWDAEIHANGITFNPLKIISIDKPLDYEHNYGDEIIIRLAIPGGTYVKRVFPFQNNLEITLYKIPVKPVTDTANVDEETEVERFTAILINKTNPALEGNGNNNPSEEALNLTNIFEIDFQLINKSLEKLRLITVGGIYHDVTSEDVIKAVLTKESASVSIDKNKTPMGVDMIPANNTAKRKHIVIPHGTKLVDIPNYVHSKCGGVYNAGMSYYFQKDFWYIYPTYNTKRYNEAKKTLTVINVPPDKLPGVEVTYRKYGSNLTIIATGEVKFKDDTNLMQLNTGNGIRFSDANKFMNGYVEVKDNKATISRGANNTEFISEERKNKNNNVLMSPNAINANPYVEYSELARKQGSLITMTWENSNDSLIFPGMLVKIMYLEGSDIKELYGTLLNVHHYTYLKEPGLLAGRHVTNSAITVFVTAPVE